MKEFFEKNKISGGYEFYIKVFGGNSNICVLTEQGKSKIDYLTYSNEWFKTYWKDFEFLYNNFMNFVKDYKIVDCWYRPDLSITNEKNKKVKHNNVASKKNNWCHRFYPFYCFQKSAPSIFLLPRKAAV